METRFALHDLIGCMTPGQSYFVSGCFVPSLMFVIFFGSGCSSGSQQKIQSELDQLQKGEYLREDYIQALCESLSPLRATRPDSDPQLVNRGPRQGWGVLDADT